MSQKTTIVIGVGPDRGLGAQLCRRFAGEGLHVLVAGRSKDCEIPDSAGHPAIIYVDEDQGGPNDARPERNSSLLRLTTFWTVAAAIAMPRGRLSDAYAASHGSIFLSSFLASRLAGFGKPLE